ncbi:PREDICTED: DNA-directed RNA polymerase, mitochondrial-like [Priapulus caudatus]|uniref:DNA-directed RNA polymerase, mitochondrial-like n=1 Tax=Priapulus caudatus TaxID=37621 RepID=A0ABM1DS67_PRICU|nr:PREDICTED: DNA-directed RNA polymerase, mitochondrial-like [Priapulus caudatus]
MQRRARETAEGNYARAYGRGETQCRDRKTAEGDYARAYRGGEARCWDRKTAEGDYTRERTEEERRGATHGKHDGGSPRTVTMAATATSDVHRHGQSSDAVAHDDAYPIHAASEDDAIRRAAPTKRLDLSVLGYDEFRCDEMDDSVENDLRLGEAAEERDHELPAVVELGFNNNLKVYVDACINTKMLSRAQTTVRFYQRRAIKHPKTNCKVSNVEIFNLLGHAWAKKGNIERIKEVFRMMREGGVLPNHQSYAAGLECLARQDMFDCDLGERILRQMEKNGLQVEAIFNKCVFHGSDREKVHEAILRIRPGIVFSLPKEYAGYATKLLTHLNVKQNKVWQDTPYLQLFTAAGLARQGRLQYEHEVTGVVGIESVEKRPPPDRHTLEMRKLLAENQIKWKKVLHTAFDRNTKVLSNKLSNTKAVNILPFLRVLRTEEFVDVMLQEVRTLAESSETFSAAMQTLYRGMGQRVLNRYTTRSKISSGLAAKIQKLYDEHLQYFIDPALTSSMNPREHWQKLLDATPEGPTVDVEDSAWPYNVLNGVGKFLYDIIIHEIKIDVSASRGKGPGKLPHMHATGRL